MKKILKIIIPVLILTVVCTTIILASSISKNDKEVAQNNDEKKIAQLEDELSSLREEGIKTKEDNVKENQLMEEIAQKQIANGTYNYDYKLDLQRCVNTVGAIISDFARTMEDPIDDKNFMEYIQEGRKLWTEVAEKYQKILDSDDLSVEEFKEKSEEFYKDEERVNNYLYEKYLSK